MSQSKDIFLVNIFIMELKIRTNSHKEIDHRVSLVSLPPSECKTEAEWSVRGVK